MAMRERISVKSEIKIGRNLETSVLFWAGGGDHAASLKAIVEVEISYGDCNTDTRIILDGRDIGSVWANGIDPSVPVAVLLR